MIPPTYQSGVQPQLHPRLLSEVSPERYLRTTFTDQALRQEHLRICPDCQHSTKMILKYQKKLDSHIQDLAYLNYRHLTET